MSQRELPLSEKEGSMNEYRAKNVGELFEKEENPDVNDMQCETCVNCGEDAVEFCVYCRKNDGLENNNVEVDANLKMTSSEIWTTTHLMMTTNWNFS